MPKLEDLELNIKQTGDIDVKAIKNVADALSKLAEHGARLGNASKSIKAVNDAVKGIKTDKAAALANVATALSKLAAAAEKASSAAGNIANIGSALRQMTESLDLSRLNSASDAISNFKKAVNSMTRTGGSKTSAVREAVESAVPSLGNDKGVASAMDEATDGIANATSRAEKFRSVLKDVGSVGVTAFKGLAIGTWNVLKGYTKLLSMAGSAVWNGLKSKVMGLTGAVGNLVHSFARIAMYRALRTAIRAITQGFSEGIKHLYEWSRVMDNTFKNSMDSLATSAHYLRDSLGAMASPLIDALAPAIEFVVDKFVSLLNIVNQFIATFTGASTWRRAVRTPTEYSSGLEEAAKSAKKATEAQKKLNKTLMDFDEIHLITTSTTNGSNPSSPSGGSGGGEDYSTHFVEEPIADWIQSIKDAIDEGDWYGAGNMLADKLNSIIDNWDARGWGEKLGQKIEYGVEFFLGFMENTKWQTAGAKLAEFFNGMANQINPELLGQALVSKFKAAIKFLNGFFNGDGENRNGIKESMQWLGDVFSAAVKDVFNLDFAKKVGEAIGGAFNAGIAFLKRFIVGEDKWVFNPEVGAEVKIKKGGIDFKEVGVSLVETILSAIRTIDWESAGTIFAKLGTGIIDAIWSAITYAAAHIEELADAIAAFAKGFFGAIWEWLLPTLKDFLFGNHYTVESANDRPNAPVIQSDSGAKTMDELQQALEDTKNGLFLTGGGVGQSASVLDKIIEQAKEAKLALVDMTGDYTYNVKSTGVTAAKNNADAIKKKLVDVANGTYKPAISYTEKGYKTVINHITALGKKTIAVPLKLKVSAVTSTTNNSGKTIETKLSKTQLQKVLNAYGEGGWPSVGDVFVANEAGPELIGTINGHTAVASNQEITGIADAVWNTGETEADLLRQQNSLLRQILVKSTTVTLAPNAAAGKWVSQAQTAYARATG